MASSTKSKICFFFQTPVNLKKRTSLKIFLEGIFRKQKKGLKSLNYIFCTDQQLLEINRKYLKHDYYTDIITFELSMKGEPIEAEIYISIDRVKENAHTLGESVQRELHRVVFHGALHLMGQRDKTTVQRREMRDLEDVYLRKYFQ